MGEARNLLTDVIYCDGPYHALEGADAVALVTEWDEFRALDIERMKSVMKSPVMIDFRNVYRPAQMAERGVRYYSIGRP